jgi:hypothetical protein
MDQGTRIGSRTRWIGEIAFNVVLPAVFYVLLSGRIGTVHALLAASAPPILWSGAEFARARRLDALSLLVLAGIVLSLVAFWGGGSVKLLQLRENLVTGLIGLAFLVSAALGKPLIFQLARATARRKSAGEAAHLDAVRDRPGFRRTMTMMTLVWGFGLLLQTALASALVFVLSITTYLVVSPVLGYGGMAMLGLWTFWYSRRARRRAETG